MHIYESSDKCIKIKANCYDKNSQLKNNTDSETQTHLGMILKILFEFGKRISRQTWSCYK